MDNDTVWLAIIIGVGACYFVILELIKEARIMKMRRKALKQKEMKKRLQAKHSKRLYKEKGNAKNKH